MNYGYNINKVKNMPIVGLNLKTMSAHFDEKKITGNLEISSTPKIENVERRDFKFAGMNDALIINFSFKTQYQPDVAEIAFTGEVVYQTEDAKKLAKSWKENKKLDDQVTVDVFNAIFRRCLTKAVQIADDLRLPPPITFPIVAPKK